MSNTYNAFLMFDILVLLISGGLCWVGIFSKSFQDNFVQRLGLGIIAIMAWGRAWYVFDHWDIGQPIFVWLHAGICLFAVGTWWKFTIRVLTAKYPWLQWKWNWGNMPYERRHSVNGIEPSKHL